MAQEMAHFPAQFLAHSPPETYPSYPQYNPPLWFCKPVFESGMESTAYIRVIFFVDGTGIR